MNTKNQLTLEQVKKFIEIGNKDSEATQTEVAARAGFDVKLLGKETKLTANGTTEYSWATPHGLLKLGANDKLSLLSKAGGTNLAETKNHQTMETTAASAPPAPTETSNANPNALIVPLASIKVQKGFNVRKDFGDIEGLAAEIEAAGLLNPLTVRPGAKAGEYILTHGERRFNALNLLESQGITGDVEVYVLPTDVNEAELEITQLLQNDGKPLTIMEQGEVYTRLKNLGLDNAKIAKRTGYTTEHIRNCVKLSEAPEELKMAVQSGEVSGTAAIKLVKGTKDKKQVVEKLQAAQAAPKGKQKGSKKITGKKLAGEAPVNKLAASEVKNRVEEVQLGLVVTQTVKKYSEERVWEILEWVRTGEGAINTLIL